MIDEENEAKFAEHGLSERQVLQILENYFITLRNRKERRGLYLVIGRDNGGRCIAAPIEPTREADVWRPITAWPCKNHEQDRLKGAGI